MGEAGGGGGCSPLPNSHMTGGRPHEEEGVGVRVSSLEKGGALSSPTYVHTCAFSPLSGMFSDAPEEGGMFSPTPFFVPFWEGKTVLQTNILILMLHLCAPVKEVF